MSLEEKQTEERVVTGGGEPPQLLSLVVFHREGVVGVPLTPGQEILIGRHPSCDVPIKDTTLSRRHARFVLRDGEVWVTDEGSSNGTWLGGKRVTEAHIQPGADVNLGAVVVSLHVHSKLERAGKGILTHEQFQMLIDQEVTRSKAFSRPLGLLMIRTAHSGRINPNRWVPRIREAIRDVDWMALYGPDIVEVALPESGQSAAMSVAQAIVNAASRPPLLCGIAIYPDAAASAEELLEVSRNAVRRADQTNPIQVGRTDQPTALISGFFNQKDGSATAPVVKSPAMLRVYGTVAKVAPSTIPVMILGETGTGKEVLARAIHMGGPRAARPLRCMNCGAIPGQLVESMLFGHERGAFTGANQRAQGIFESAHGGTVLLDEIGELPLAAQAALLRFLETKTLTRVGATREIAVDVRILAATHRDLEAMCREGTFRQDLLFRLNTMVLEIPPLRQRREEIEPLALFFVQQASAISDRPLEGIAPDAVEALQRYHWPGNVRELRNVIERSAVVAQRSTIGLDDLPQHIRSLKLDPSRRRPAHTISIPPPQPGQDEEEEDESNQTVVFRMPADDSQPDDDGPARDPGQPVAATRPADTARSVDGAPPSVRPLHESSSTELRMSFRSRVERFEAALLLWGLEQTSDNQSEAASLLGIPPRTMTRKLGRIRKKPHQVRHEVASDPELTRLDLAALVADSGSFATLVQQFESQLIASALEATGGNQTQAAKRLVMPLRTMVYKIKSYGIQG